MGRIKDWMINHTRRGNPYQLTAEKKHITARYNPISTFICPRCGGSGTLSQYTHIKNGMCFQCNGHGVIMDNPEKELK